MDEATRVLSAAAEAARAGRAFVLMTVIRTQGSTPRAPGAMMLWLGGDVDGREAEKPPAPPIAGSAADARVEDVQHRANGADLAACFVGTVGGGQFEHLALDDARRYLRERRSGVERYVLGAEAEQCCGGVIEIFFQYHGGAQRAVIFGAGHVAHELVKLLETSPIACTVVDDRADWNTAARFPRAERLTDWQAGINRCGENPAGTLAVVMTCSHQTDERLLRGLLTMPALPLFVGLIGSRSKKACLLGRLISSGVDEHRVERVRCPLGVGDTGKEPGVLAISIAAQLLIEAKRATDAAAGTPRRSSASLGEIGHTAPESAHADLK